MLNITEGMINEVKQFPNRDSINFKELLFYTELMNDIDKKFSNNELEALKYILTELGRNVDYELMNNRELAKYKINVELTKDNRMNNIRLRVFQINYLLMDNGSHEFRGSCNIKYDLLPFYKKDIEMIKKIYNRLEEFDLEYSLINKEEAINKIAELTGYKMA